MARKKLVHIHSNVLNKMPKPADLNVGELAVNNNVDNEFISLKNTDEEVVRFSSDKQLVSWMNEKEVFPVSGDVSTDIASNTSQIIIRNNQYADSATTGADVVNHSGAVIDTSAFALSGGNVTFNSVTVNDISAVTINGKDANSLGDITNITYTPNDEIEDGVSGNTLEFAQSGNNNTVSVNLVFDDELNNTSVNAVQNKVLNDVLEEMEEVTAASLNDLNDRVLELENTPDLHVTGGRFSGGTLYIEQENGPTVEIPGISGGGGEDGNNYPTSLTLNSNNVLVLGRNGLSALTADLSTLDTGNAPTSGMVEHGTGAQSGSTFINFYNGTTKLFSVNADDLMIDGMVESVSIGQAIPDGETEVADCLIVVWNTAAGNKTTNLPLSSIFNPNNYYTKQDIQNNYYTKQDVYTKQEVNNALGDDFIPSSVTSSVTAVINGLEDRVGDLENKQDIHVVSGSFSQASATLTLTMSSGNPITVSGMVTGGGDDPIVAYNNYVTGGSVGNDGVITLVHNVDGDHSVQDATVTGLEAYINSKTSGFVEPEDDKHVIGGSVNNQGIIVVEQNGISPNVELSGLPSYVDSRLNGKYLPLSGGTVSGNTTFTSDLVASGSNGITATKFVKNGGTNSQVLMADGSVKELGTITGDNYVSGGSVDSQGVIHLANTDPTNNGEITGLSDYVSSVTQNFITADKDKYVSGGTVGNDGVITLNLRHGGTAPVTGLETYINNKLDGNDYVVSGSVNSSTGIITLKNTDPAKDGRITGLSRYVGDYVENYMSEYAPVGDWVDISGDTMTGPLAISGRADGGELVDELFGVTNTYTNNKIFSIMNQGGSDHIEVTNSSFIVNSTLSVDAGSNVHISGDTDIDGALEVTDGVVDKGDLRVSGETRIQNGVYAGGGVYSRDGFHYYMPNTSGYNSNAYVLLAGGGVKPLSDFTTGGGDPVSTEQYLESATLDPSTGNIEFGVHEGDNVTLSGLSTYVLDKANSAAYNVASRYLPLAGGELNSTYSEHNNPVLKINGSTGSTSGSPVLDVHGHYTGNPSITDATTNRTITTNGRVLANGFVHYKFKDGNIADQVGYITVLNAYGGTYQLITGQTVYEPGEGVIDMYSGTAELHDSVREMTNSLNHLSGVTVNLSGKTDEVSAKTDNNTITIHGLETDFSGLSHNFADFSGNVKNNYTTKSGVTDIVKAELSGGSKTYLDDTYASKDSVNDLGGSIADLNGKTNEISGKTDNNIITIHDLENGLSGLNHSFTEFSGTANNNFVKISGFSDAVKAELSGGSKTYLDSNYATTSSVNDLSGSVSDLNGKTNEISGKTDNNTITIHGLETDFSGLNHSFTEFSGNVKNNYATKSGVTDAVKAEISGGSKTYLDSTYASKDSVTDLNGSISDLSNKTDEISGKTDGNTISIHGLETNFSGLNHSFTEFSGTANNNFVKISGFSDAVKAELSGGSKTYLDSNYATTSSVNDLSGSVSDLNNKTNEISGKTDNNTTTIHGLETDFSGLNHSFTEFSGNVKNNYATKSGVTDTVKAELSGGSKSYLDATYATTSSVNDLNGSINNLNSTVNEVSGKTENNTVNIHGLETDFSGLSHSFADFSGNVRDNYATKTGVTDAVKAELSGGSKSYLDATYATTSSVNDLSGDIADLRTSATTNADDISNLSTGITSLSGVVGNNFNTLNNKFSDYATSAAVESNYVKLGNLNNAIATSTTITNMQAEVNSKLSNGETIVVSAGTASNMTGSTVASDKIKFVNGNDSTTIDASGVEIKDGLNQMLFNENGITFANVNSNPRIIFTGGTWVERSGVTAPNASVSSITSNDITTDELETTSARTTNLRADTENVGNLYVGGINGPVVAELKANTPNMSTGTFSFSGSVKSTGGFVYNNASVSASTGNVLTTNGSYKSLANIATDAAFTGRFVQRDGDIYLENDYKTTGDVSGKTLGATNLVVDGGNVTIGANDVSIKSNAYSVSAKTVYHSEYHLGGPGSGDMEFYGLNMSNPSLVILDPSYPYGSNGTIVKLIDSKMSIINGNGDEVGYIMGGDHDSIISATTVYTSNGSVQTSDARLKENVSSISDEAIANVAKVDLKSFNMIGDKDKTVKYGVIAQELNDAGLTNIAKEGPDGYYGVDYTSFLILKIAQLEKKIKELEEKLK